MKILFVNNFSNFGGASISMQRMISALAQVNNIEVSLVTFGNQNEEQIGLNLQNEYKIKAQKFSLITNNPVFSMYARKKFTEILDELQPDCVHLNIYYGYFTSSIISVIRARGIKIIQTVHDNRYICQANDATWKNTQCHKCRDRSAVWALLRNCNGSLGKTVVNFWERQIYIRSSSYIDRIIYVSYHQKSNNNLFLKHPGSNVIYNSVDKPDIETVSNERKHYFLIVSRISAGKGIDAAIRAFVASKSALSFNLIIAGDGPIKDQLEKKYTKLCDNGTVKFIGNINQAEIKKLISECWALIAPSELAETFGLTLIEAARSKTPVLASNRGAHAEISKLINGDVYETNLGLTNKLDNFSQLEPTHLPRHFLADELTEELVNLYNGVLHEDS